MHSPSWETWYLLHSHPACLCTLCHESEQDSYLFVTKTPAASATQKRKKNDLGQTIFYLLLMSEFYIRCITATFSLPVHSLFIPQLKHRKSCSHSISSVLLYSHPPRGVIRTASALQKNFFADNLMFSNVLCLTQLFRGLGEKENSLISLTSEEIWSKVVTSVAELSDLAFIGQCKFGQQRIQMQTDSSSPLLRNNK